MGKVDRLPMVVQLIIIIVSPVMPRAVRCFYTKYTGRGSGPDRIMASSLGRGDCVLLAVSVDDGRNT